jgi:hypothetical protein
MQEKKKVLIVSSYCFDKATANGLCARALYDCSSQQLDTYLMGIGNAPKDDGNQISIKNYEQIHRKGSHLRAKLKSFKSFFTPLLNEKLIKQYYKEIKDLDERIGIDIVVAMFFPPEIASAVSRYKRINRDFKYVIYELDSFTDGVIQSNGYSKKLKEMAKIRWTKRQYKFADLMIPMDSHEESIKKTYPAFLNKIAFAGLPLLVDNTSESNGDNDNGISFLYTGELNLSYRSPKKLFETIEYLKNCSNWHFDFFTKGDCESSLRELAEKDSRVSAHGYVDRSVVDDYYRRADFLLSIGNACSNSMPSKIINYISTGKPIIHFCLQKKDVAAELLKKYPLALIVSSDVTVTEASKLIRLFVNEKNNRRLPFSEIKSIFYRNDPQFSINYIAQFD